jgi:LysR family transcriptional regulator (chromosome initiation inhibitor)
MGWGMVPDLQRPSEDDADPLVDLDPSGAIDVVLHWQQWKLGSGLLDRVAAAVTAAARGQLVQ